MRVLVRYDWVPLLKGGVWTQTAVRQCEEDGKEPAIWKPKLQAVCRERGLE